MLDKPTHAIVYITRPGKRARIGIEAYGTTVELPPRDITADATIMAGLSTDDTETVQFYSARSVLP